MMMGRHYFDRTDEVHCNLVLGDHSGFDYAAVAAVVVIAVVSAVAVMVVGFLDELGSCGSG